MKFPTQQRGFTLIELLVVISIIGLLSSVVLSSLNSARIKARDSIRKQHLVQLRTALEIYYNQNGSYPITGSATFFTSNPGGEIAGISDNGGNWIPGLVASGAIGSLPQDPLGGESTNPVCASGWHRAYLYRSDDGTSYKLLNHCGPEGNISTSDAFYDPAPRPTWSFMITSNPTRPGGGLDCNPNYDQSYPACW